MSIMSINKLSYSKYRCSATLTGAQLSLVVYVARVAPRANLEGPTDEGAACEVSLRGVAFGERRRLSCA